MLNIFLASFFLLLNSLFVLIEFAIVRSRPTKFEELSQKGSKTAKISLGIVSNLNSYLASIQLGITIASIGLGWIAQPLVSNLIKNLFVATNIEIIKYYSYSISIVVSFIIVTSLHIILGEQVPKYIAISIAEKITMFFAIPLKIFYEITFYPMLFINKTSEFFVRLVGIKKNKESQIYSEDEIRLILSQSEELGRISLQRLMMFEHIFDFGKTTVKEIMTPVDKTIFVNANSSYLDFINILNRHKFSRYPVKDGDRIIGFVHIKEVLLNRAQNVSEFDIRKFLREIKTVNQDLPIERTLRFFQENNIHISLVSNEKDEVAGILSVEDIIEDITGEIRDEFEKRPTYRLDKILDKDSSIMDIKSLDKFEAINEMINKILKNKLNFSIKEAKEKIIKREKLFSTAIGHQIAIPHARIEGLKTPIIIVGKSENGINFIAPDQKPVKLIFLIFSPFNDSSIQLNILSKISKMISNVTLKKKLLNAKTVDKIEEVMTIFEDNIPAD